MNRRLEKLPEPLATAEPEAAVAVIRCRSPLDSILLLRRQRTRSDPWSGHFALPGGRRDPGDRSLLHTCLRETREETSVELGCAALREILPPRIAGNSVQRPILVQPYLFELDRRPEVVPDSSEIASFLWLEVERFRRQEKHILAETIPSRPSRAYPLDDYYLWGFTYGLLCWLLRLEA